MSDGLNIKIRIDLDRIRRNLAAIRNESAGAKVMLMLKADAYGHGIERVAEATEDFVDGFGVVTLKEAVRIREITCVKPILVNMLLADELSSAIDYDLTIGLSNASQLERIVVEKERKKAKIHLAVDSGMHRLGFDPCKIDDACKALKDAGVNVCGVYSHLGDHPDVQLKRFTDACDKVREYFPEAMRHIASTHSYKVAHFDGIRVGLGAYLGAMSVESEVVASRRVQAGEYIGYGDYLTAKPTNIAVVFGGYADGVDRERFPSVTARGGRKFKVISVCMDTFLIDTEEILLNSGETVTLTDGETLENTAVKMGTVPYVLMTAWKGRIDKIYC